jgi:AmmeMemoRadiSam system protein B
VAAEAFASVGGLKGRVRRAVLIGPAHYVPVDGIAAPSYQAFATPLGEMPIDTGAVADLAAGAFVTIDDAPHAPEHAIEVELPFLQMLFGPLPILPLLFGATSPDAVAAVLAETWTEHTLLVVSSDLSHHEAYEVACKRDARTAAAIEAFDHSRVGPADACGHLAICGALKEAARRGFESERLVLSNSGDSVGDRRSVVGYGAWTFHGRRPRQHACGAGDRSGSR